MSTNLERITEHNTRLAALKEVAAGLPEAGSGGGGAVETCTVTINVNTVDNYYIVYTSYENGVLVPKSKNSFDYRYNSIDIQSVVNSYIILLDAEGRMEDPIVSDNLSITNVNQLTDNTVDESTILEQWRPVYVVTINSGTTGTITI